MLPILLSLGVIICALPGPVLAALKPPANASTGAPTIVERPGDEQTTIVLRTPGSGGPQDSQIKTKVVRVDTDEADAPKIWIGVRLTPVPAPLAAHIGERGVMIANVVKQSPADQAGLEQYDVVVAIGGKDVSRPQDLGEAVAKGDAGMPVRLQIVRQAKSQEVVITPVERPATLDGELKYEEPQEAVVDDAVNMRGLMLNQGPGGDWIMRDLGPLKGLSGALKGLDNLDFNVELPDLPGQDKNVHILRKLDRAFRGDAEDDAQARIEMKIQVDESGKCTTIHKDSDGQIHVTHVAPDGKETTATYEDEEAFEQADPESYHFYTCPGEPHPSIFRYKQSSPDRARELRWEYQIDVESKVKEALEKAEQARATAEAKARGTLDEAQKHAARAHEKAAKRSAESAGAAEKLAVRVHDDGRVSIVVNKGASQEKYEFKSKKELQASKPDLYERIKSLLD